MQFVALLYDGISQQFVRVEAQDEKAFFSALDKQYPCYVCLWHSHEATAVQASVPQHM
ncbi:MAG: hypothetical protein VX066_03810 [Pseudomonadota bacterium]|uniref:hypothetical protein n=1 Tax=Marisediminitalea aggregata TaxID=634436 RepID=UPI0020CB92C3|nr:hypothetical protein [Marisediminitalea aggregata]MCP3863324.1 hypothetical protein [Aestuariibacter sp.]MEC7826603.1 hypothetical protein [Pseudomonadota bacterium]MCP4234054.1 hypothetical protein [Aestuariibacter sp.]MCP4528451.1 hypothetical protein [Aestuariibacter sp.]MCP4949476.1 hypothetical protein [Aestuariibacter sp.]